MLSHVQLANRPDDLHATRVALGEADLVIGCDALVSASPEVLSRLRPDHGRAVVNSTAAPTAAFLARPDWRFPGEQAEAALARSAPRRNWRFIGKRGRWPRRCWATASTPTPCCSAMPGNRAACRYRSTACGARPRWAAWRWKNLARVRDWARRAMPPGAGGAQAPAPQPARRRCPNPWTGGSGAWPRTCAPTRTRPTRRGSWPPWRPCAPARRCWPTRDVSR